MVLIKVKEEVIGVSRLFSEVEGELTKEEIILACAFISREMGFQNASLYRMLQQDMKKIC